VLERVRLRQAFLVWTLAFMPERQEAFAIDLDGLSVVEAQVTDLCDTQSTPRVTPQGDTWNATWYRVRLHVVRNLGGPPIAELVSAAHLSDAPLLAEGEVYELQLRDATSTPFAAALGVTHIISDIGPPGVCAEETVVGDPLSGVNVRIGAPCSTSPSRLPPTSSAQAPDRHSPTPPCAKSEPPALNALDR
jgi:hypothetical protein